MADQEGETSTSATPGEESCRFILITQCLQNDFFLNPACRLGLPPNVSGQMLLSKRQLRRGTDIEALLQSEKAIAEGPLGRFLEASVGRRFRKEPGAGGVLHVINIRDWHDPSPGYDLERRNYGAHCEVGTPGAAYINGLTHYLDPGGAGLSEKAGYHDEGDARIYHIHADSVFDFKLRPCPGPDRSYMASELEDVLDVLVQGTDAEVEQFAEYQAKGDAARIHKLARGIDRREQVRHRAQVYVAVIGVYTDIKVQNLLVGLRTQYELSNLAISDTLTASRTLERHLAGLDYAAKVLGAEVVHGVNDLVRFLDGSPPIDDESQVLTGEPFSDYQSFFQDKQNVLAYENERLRDYLELTEQRSIGVYEGVKRSSLFLLTFGSVFLAVTLLGAVLTAVWPDRFDWKLSLVTGGIGMLQLVSVFYSKPIRDLQQNLTNLAMFRMVLETHSLKTALARFHLTTPQTLRELRTPGEAEEAERQVRALQHQIAAIQEFDTADFAQLARLAMSIDDSTAGGESPLTSELRRRTTPPNVTEAATHPVGA